MLKKFSSHAQMANTSEVAEWVVFMRIGQLFALCKHSLLPSKHASKNVAGSMESKSLAVTVPLWIQFPGWFSCDAAAFELHGDFESCFIRRVSHKLSGGEDSRRCLPLGLHPRSLHQIPHWCPNERGNSKNILTTRRHARAKPSCVNRRSKRGLFSLVPKIDVRPFIDC